MSPSLYSVWGFFLHSFQAKEVEVQGLRVINLLLLYLALKHACLSFLISSFNSISGSFSNMATSFTKPNSYQTNKKRNKLKPLTIWQWIINDTYNKQKRSIQTTKFQVSSFIVNFNYHSQWVLVLQYESNAQSKQR